MRKMSALFVAAVAGTAIAAPQTAMNRVLHEGNPKLDSASANRVVDMAGNPVAISGVANRVEVGAYNTYDDPTGLMTAGRNLWWSRLGGYDGTGDGFIFFTIFGTDCSQLDPVFGDPNCLTFDNGTPTDPSDDVLTDVIFDDYHANPADIPGDIDALYDLAEVQTNVLIRNPEVFDNGTPTDPSDDFPDIRSNTFSNIFFGITDDNGTPTDPSDDGVAFVDGYGADFTWPADAFTNFRLTIDLRGGGFQAPGRGLTVYDWQNVATFGITGDNGIYFTPVGGDTDVVGTPAFDSTGAGPIPDWAGLIQNAGPIDETFWLWGSSTQADPTFDGDGATTSYEDVLFASPAIVNWTFNGDAAGNWNPANVVPFLFVYDVEDTTCPIDYASATDPNTPDGALTGADFFAFLSLFQAGDLSADLAGPTDPTTPDGALTGADFFRFLDLFQSGCVL